MDDFEHIKVLMKLSDTNLLHIDNCIYFTNMATNASILELIKNIYFKGINVIGLKIINIELDIRLANVITKIERTNNLRSDSQFCLEFLRNDDHYEFYV